MTFLTLTNPNLSDGSRKRESLVTRLDENQSSLCKLLTAYTQTRKILACATSQNSLIYYVPSYLKKKTVQNILIFSSCQYYFINKNSNL